MQKYIYGGLKVGISWQPTKEGEADANLQCHNSEKSCANSSLWLEANIVSSVLHLNAHCYLIWMRDCKLQRLRKGGVLEGLKVTDWWLKDHKKCGMKAPFERKQQNIQYMIGDTFRNNVSLLEDYIEKLQKSMIWIAAQ